MANEKRLIDAKKALYLAEYSGLYDFDLSALETLLLDEPCITVDAVEVVRCKDCNWHTGCQAPSVMFCKKYNTFMAADDFCSYGERGAEDGQL